MKNLKYILLLLVTTFMFSCDDETTEYGETIFESADPFIQLLTEQVAFVAGVPDYNLQFVVIQGASDATSVNVNKTFVDAASGETSDPVFLANYPIDVTKTSTTIDAVVDFALLREGILIGGNPLTTDENLVAVGSKWILTIEPVNTGGAISFETSKTIEVAVLSAYAGNYLAIATEYYRLGALQATQWTGTERFLGSVNDTTFSHPQWFGAFAFPDPTSQFVFYLDKTNNKVLIPAKIDGVSQPVSFGEYFVSCEDEGPDGDMSHAHCATSNILIPDFATGKHQFRLSYGYYASIGTGVIATREFYEELEKIVE